MYVKYKANVLSILSTYRKHREDEYGGEKRRSLSALISWSVHHNLAPDGYIESTCSCVQARFLGMETQRFYTEV
jgi:hypothetical protein